jgi:hypothetical protein
MNITPQSEDQLRASMLLPDGDYPFEVASAEDKISSSNNEMIALQLRVFKPDGAARTQRDWLVNSPSAMMQMKIRHFARSCGLMDQYNAGTLDSLTCQGAAGVVKIRSKNDEQYGPQNYVADYVSESEEAEADPLPKGPTAAQTKAANGVAESDDVPF